MKSLFRTTLQVIVAMLVLFLGTAAHAQQTVTGKVVDAGGQPVVGATVLVEGTTNGVITAGDGSFSIRSRAGDMKTHAQPFMRALSLPSSRMPNCWKKRWQSVTERSKSVT